MLISLQDIHLAFGGPPLLDGVNLQLEEGDRACLLGRNGAGKSTLLKVLAGELPYDGGEIQRGQGVRVTLLPQEVPAGLAGTVYDIVLSGVPAAEAAEEWRRHAEAERVLSLIGMEGSAPFASLSGGLKRRALLGRALAGSPDLLLLDEPTNHLDIEAIAWLEEFLLRSVKTFLFVTHDRAFLRRLANRIVELDRGRIVDWRCGYDLFLERREAMLEAEAKERALFDKKLAQEEAWIRQGIKARRTRNEGRVRELQKMRAERKARRERVGNVRLEAREAERSGKLVVEAEDVSFSWSERPVVTGFSTTIVRGDRVGLIGPNGSGKTTLLNLLLGRLQPQQGMITLGTRLQIAYFDQMREQLDEVKSVQENVGEGNDTVEVNGRRRHVIGYLQDFLFSPDRARSPVSMLSGGERNRLLLAKLFTKPFNLLVLDEPTNDLDMETLDLLEELLMEYQGTLLLVSHDREFLNNVVTSTLVFEGGGRIAEYVGGYDDWLAQRPRDKGETPAKREEAPRRAKVDKPRKLSYKEQKELEALPARIEELETELESLHTAMADPEFYRRGEGIVEARTRLAALEEELATAYGRWEELEEIATAE